MGLILGDKEKNENLISYRIHGSNGTITMKLDEFINMINTQIKDKK